MSASESGENPQTQPAFSGRPPKITTRGIQDRPDEPSRRVFLWDLVFVEDLAETLKVRPFKVVAKLLEMGQFKHANEAVDFDTASIIAREFGCRAERAEPGLLPP